MNTRTGPRARRFLRVQIAKTTRTDLLCIHCGGFGNARPMLAIIAPGQDTADAQAGIHRKCIALVKAPRAPRRPAAADPELLARDPSFVPFPVGRPRP